jgi:hypothetical protein
MDYFILKINDLNFIPEDKPFILKIPPLKSLRDLTLELIWIKLINIITGKAIIKFLLEVFMLFVFFTKY